MLLGTNQHHATTRTIPILQSYPIIQPILPPQFHTNILKIVLIILYRLQVISIVPCNSITISYQTHRLEPLFDLLSHSHSSNSGLIEFGKIRVLFVELGPELEVY